MAKQGDKARQAMLRRSREKNQKDNMTPYYAVIGFFCAVMVGALVYTVLNPQQSFAQMPIIDESSILVHNGQGHRYNQGSNEFFADWVISDAKVLFDSGLADTPEIAPCKSKDDENLEVPESFDFRNEYPDCVQAPPVVSRNCSSSYVQSTLSAVEDRICKNNGVPIKLSAQEVLDCNSADFGCKGGNVNKVLNWGKRKGFMPEQCYPFTGEQGECPEEHLTENICRQTNNFYKIIDYCLAQEFKGVQKEILTNGPVLGQLTPNTDFLTYSDGTYHKTIDAFKFQGNHIVKVVGWETGQDGAISWIIENTWGEDWGQGGYAHILQGESMLDFYAIGFAAYPLTMADYYQQQEAAQQPQFTIDPVDPAEADFEIDGEQVDLDEEPEEFDPEL